MLHLPNSPRRYGDVSGETGGKEEGGNVSEYPNGAPGLKQK